MQKYTSVQLEAKTELRSVYACTNIIFLTLVLLNPDIPAFANSIDPDQLASEEAK